MVMEVLRDWGGSWDDIKACRSSEVSSFLANAREFYGLD